MHQIAGANDFDHGPALHILKVLHVPLRKTIKL